LLIDNHDTAKIEVILGDSYISKQKQKSEIIVHIMTVLYGMPSVDGPSPKVAIIIAATRIP